MKALATAPCNLPSGLSRIAIILEERIAMAVAATVLTLLVILIHVYIVVLEMVLWRTRGPKVFGITPEFARDSTALASNQGLYNAFLVVALVLGLVLREPFATAFVFYGLGCVVVAGLWGALTASRRILYVQALPAALALAAQWLAR
jgi:putative membrane protein